MSRANYLGEPKKSVKQTNRPNTATQHLWDAIDSIVKDPAYDAVTLTTRQIYYQCVTRGAVAKNNDAQYNRVQRAVLQMRRQGALAWWRVRDGARERVSWRQHNGLADALADAARMYRRNVMRLQPVHVELWVEKDSLSGFLAPIGARYGVPYAALRGFPSDGFQFEATEDWRAMARPVVVVYAGDFDPSGRAIAERLESNLRYFYDAVTVEHIGLHQPQIAALRLPPSFEVKDSDTRAPGFARRYGTSCTELDAVPPDVLQRWYEDALLRHVNESVLAREWEVERLEKDQLAEISRWWSEAAPPPQ